MQTDNANAVRVCLITGLRIGDVLALRRENITAQGKIETVCQKTKKPFAGTIPVKLAEALLFHAGADWIFPSPVARCAGKHRTRQTVWRDIKRAAKLCAVPRNITPHSARKIYAVDQFRKNGITAAQNSLQHDKMITTMIYAFSDQLAAEAEREKNKKTNDQKKTVSVDLDAVMTRFYDAFGGKESFAACVAKLIGAGSGAPTTGAPTTGAKKNTKKSRTK